MEFLVLTGVLRNGGNCSFDGNETSQDERSGYDGLQEGACRNGWRHRGSYGAFAKEGPGNIGQAGGQRDDRRKVGL